MVNQQAININHFIARLQCIIQLLLRRTLVQYSRYAAMCRPPWFAETAFMRNTVLTTVIMLFTIGYGIAQNATFITAGKIEFEKKINQHRHLEDEGEENFWVTEQKKWLTKTATDIFELRFTAERTLYKLQKENTDNKYLWGTKPSETDVVIQDMVNQNISIQRDVFENTYLIKDSLRKVEWRITNETRTIAGFECKKAVGIFCDSVYVVAFYTDEIMVSSGPESFGGLPGMILGLAVPRLYTTWFATKVELNAPAESELTARQKGKKVNYKELIAEMNKGIKDWGKEAAKRIWTAVL